MWSGTIATTFDPPNPPVPWSFESTDLGLFSAVSCSSDGGVCVATSHLGSVISAPDGTSADPSWGAPEPFPHEGLEDVDCAPADAFCLVVDDQGYATVGTVGDDGTTEPAGSEVASPPPSGTAQPRQRRCKAKRSKGKRMGVLAIGGAIPLDRAPRAVRIGRSPCGSR